MPVWSRREKDPEAARRNCAWHESKTLPVNPRDRVCTGDGLYAKAHVARRGRIKVVPREVMLFVLLKGMKSFFVAVTCL